MPLANETRSLMNRQALLFTSSAVLAGLAGYYLYRKLASNEDYNSRRRSNKDIVFKRYKRSKQNHDEIERIMQDFKVSESTLNQVMELFERDIEKGLDPVHNSESNLKMLPTFVCDLPSGQESGDILTLDLGGSNFRVVLIRLRPNAAPEMSNKIFILSEYLMKGSGKQLFDYIASCIVLFIKCQHLDLSKEYPLGFTFSFPCEQHGLRKAVLLRWTKGFNCNDTVGRNVVEMLQESIDACNEINVKVVSLINDTVGTLMSCAYKDPNTNIGLILGTGSNGCYFENMNRIGKLSDCDMNNNRILNRTDEPKQMLLNIELGAFGENGCIDFLRTKYDEEIDKASINVGMQIFEKMVAGMYLGEIVRLIILDLIDRELILREEMKKSSYRHPLFTKASFYTKYITEIESDIEPTYPATKQILKELSGVNDISQDECAVVKYVCELITERSAKLVAATSAVLVNRCEKKETTISVDGGMFRFHRNLNRIFELTLAKLVKPEYKFKIVLSKDGSGRGAAVVAAMASQNESKQQS